MVVGSEIVVSGKSSPPTLVAAVNNNTNRKWIRKEGAEGIPFIDGPAAESDSDDPGEAFL